MYKDNLLENFTSFFYIIFSEIMSVHAPQIFNILFMIIKDIVLQDEKCNSKFGESEFVILFVN